MTTMQPKPPSSFYIDVPARAESPAGSSTSSSLAAPGLKRVASTQLDSASDPDTSVVPDSVDEDGDSGMVDADAEEEPAVEEVKDTRENKRARRSDGKPELIHCHQDLKSRAGCDDRFFGARSRRVSCERRVLDPAGSKKKCEGLDGRRLLSERGLEDCRCGFDPTATGFSKTASSKATSANLKLQNIPPTNGDESSGLSSIESDDEASGPAPSKGAKPAPAASKSTKPKRVTTAPAPKLLPAAAPAVPKPRTKPAPRVVSPPTLIRLPLAPYTPSSAVISKLHLREFFIRFHHLIPTLSLASTSSTSRQSSMSSKTAKIILAALDDSERFWGPGSDVNQRGVLEGILDLLKEDYKYIFESPADTARKIWLEEVMEEIASAKKSASVEVASVPWSLLWSALEEGKEGGWGEMEKEWTEEREKAEAAGEKKRRGGKGEVGVEKRLMIMCCLVDIAAGTQPVRKEMQNGIDTERAAKIELNKQKAKLRADLQEAKQKVAATRPGEVSPSKVAAVKAKWKEDMAKAAKEVKELEKDYESNLRVVHHDLHLASTSNRLRLTPLLDTDSNTYYIPAPTPETAYPVELDTDALPLSWTVIIHGTAFPSASTSPKKKVDEESANFTRKSDDEWFVVGDPNEINKLADFVEYRAKKAKFDSEADAEKKVKGKGKEDVEEEIADVSELVGSLRVYADYLMTERARAHEGPSTRRGRRSS
ncbi:hypothetical protein P7C70_g1861, partial [Phenoliferia sp. Uapishka_3]